MINGRGFNEERDDSVGIVLSRYCIIGNITNYNNNFKAILKYLCIIVYDGRSRNVSLDNSFKVENTGT